jgi:ABC-type Fe3+/spermidine/putrescine transport system ATPase subunit
VALLKVARLSKTYSAIEQNAVHEVSFELEKGGLLALVGESGCGKTSLLRLIAGFEEPDSGEVYLKSERVYGPSRNLVPGHPDIRMVYQQYELEPNSSVFKNIAYALRAYHKEYQVTRTNELMELCDIQTLKDKLPRELSGGEQQRVAIARALAEEPALLLLDEPFSNLDVLLKQELKVYFHKVLKEAGATAIFVTHDGQDALSMADQIAVMQKGSIVQLDEPFAIYQKPENEYVARFFGLTNLFERAFLEQYFNIDLGPFKKAMLRPEHIKIAEEGQAHVEARITNLQYLGAFMLIEAEIMKYHKVWLLSDQFDFQLGDIIPVEFNFSKLYTFK